MKCPFRVVAAVLSALFLLISCGRNGKLIPDSVFPEMIAEMLLADQWLDRNPAERRTADTTLFYEPIFNRYGYSFKDFDRSLSYYIEDDDHLERILKETEKILLKESSRLGKLKEKSDKAKEFNEAIGGYERIDFNSLKISLSLVDRADTVKTDTVVESPGKIPTLQIPVDTMTIRLKENLINVEGRHSIRPDTLKAPRKFVGHKPAPISRKAVQL